MRTVLYLLVLITVGCRDAHPSARHEEILPPASTRPGTVDETTAITIVKRAVASNDTWAERAVYEARSDGSGWSVTAYRIEGYDSSGKPKFVFGGDRTIHINENGAVTSYVRGL